MVDTCECNKEESQRILDFYLKGGITITSIYKISDDYYMSCSTPYLKKEKIQCNFRYKDYASNEICLIEVWKNSRIYSLKDVKVSEEFDNACKEAIRKYEEKRSLNFPEGLSFGKKEERLMTKDRKILFVVLFLYFLTLLGVCLYLF